MKSSLVENCGPGNIYGAADDIAARKELGAEMHCSGNILVINSDDREFPDEPSTWFLQETHGPLPEKTVIVNTKTDGCYRMYFSLPEGCPIRSKTIADGISLKKVSAAAPIEADSVMSAPGWLIELAGDVNYWNLDEVRGALTDYLVANIEKKGECLPDDPIVVSRNDALYFNARDFGYSINVRRTSQLSALYGQLSALGVKIRQSLTLTMDGKRRVLKMAKWSGSEIRPSVCLS